MHSALALSAVFSLALAGTACQNTVDGVKKDTEQAADSTADARRDAREAADDVRRAAASAADRASESIERASERIGAAVQGADVKAALMADPSVDAARIDVDADAATKTIRLEGSVASEAERDMAGIIAGGHAPGYTIDNRLTVAPRQ
jgi:hypothetical protein